MMISYGSSEKRLSDHFTQRHFLVKVRQRMNIWPAIGRSYGRTMGADLAPNSYSALTLHSVWLRRSPEETAASPKVNLPKISLALFQCGSHATQTATRGAVSYTHLRAHETPEHLVCRLLLE